MSHVFAVGSYPAAFILRHYLIIFHDDEFLPEHLLPWIELAMLTTATKVSKAIDLLNVTILFGPWVQNATQINFSNLPFGVQNIFFGLS